MGGQPIQHVEVYKGQHFKSERSKYILKKEIVAINRDDRYTLVEDENSKMKKVLRVVKLTQLSYLDIKKDLDLLVKFKSPYVVDHLDHFMSRSYDFGVLCVVTENFNCYRLDDLLKGYKKRNVRLSAEKISKFSGQIIKGAEFLNDRKIDYLSTSKNVFVYETGNVKIGSVGIRTQTWIYDMVSGSIGRKQKGDKSSLSLHSRQLSFLAIVIYQMVNTTCLDNLLSKKNYNFPCVNETCYQLYNSLLWDEEDWGFYLNILRTKTATENVVELNTSDKSAISCVKLFDDNKKMIVGHESGQIKIWRLTGNWVCTGKLVGHSKRVNKIKLISKSNMASASQDSTIRIWDLTSGRCTAILAHHTKNVNYLTVVDDNKRLVSASFDRTLKIWNVEQLTCEHTIKLDQIPPFVKLIQQKTQVLVSQVKSLKFYNVQTGQLSKEIRHETNCVDFRLLSESQILTYSPGGHFKLWDINAGICLKTIDELNCIPKCYDIQNGKLIVGLMGGKISVWDLEKSERLLLVRSSPLEQIDNIKESGRIRSIVFLSDEYFVSATTSGSFKLWQIDAGDVTLIETIKSYKTNLTRKFENSKILCTDRNMVKVIEFSRFDPFKELKSIEDLEKFVKKPFNRQVKPQDLVEFKKLSFLDHYLIKFDDSFQVEYLKQAQGNELEFVEQQSSIVTVYDQDTLIVWNDKKKLMRVKYRMPFSLNGLKRLKHFNADLWASISDDSRLQIWNYCTFESFDLNFSKASPVKYKLVKELPKGVLLAISNDNAIELWNLSRRTCEDRLNTGKQSHIVSVKPYLNSTYLVVGKFDTIQIWQMQNHECVNSIEQATGLLCMKIVPNENKMVSVGLDKVLRIYDLSNPSQVTLIGELKGHEHDITKLKLGPSGHLLSASLDKTIKFWNLKTNQCERTLTHYEEVIYVKILTDGGLMSVCKKPCRFHYPMIHLWNKDLVQLNIYDDCYADMLHGFGIDVAYVENSVALFCNRQSSQPEDESLSSENKTQILPTDNSPRILNHNSQQFLTYCKNGLIKIWEFVEDNSELLQLGQINTHGQVMSLNFFSHDKILAVIHYTSMLNQSQSMLKIWRTSSNWQEHSIDQDISLEQPAHIKVINEQTFVFSEGNRVFCYRDTFKGYQHECEVLFVKKLSSKNFISVCQNKRCLIYPIDDESDDASFQPFIDYTFCVESNLSISAVKTNENKIYCGYNNGLIQILSFNNYIRRLNLLESLHCQLPILSLFIHDNKLFVQTNDRQLSFWSTTNNQYDHCPVETNNNTLRLVKSMSKQCLIAVSEGTPFIGFVDELHKFVNVNHDQQTIGLNSRVSKTKGFNGRALVGTCDGFLIVVSDNPFLIIQSKEPDVQNQPLNEITAIKLKKY